ncbi:MAG: DUF3500 domain-containing protein [Planctomycetota bacterium]
MLRPTDQQVDRRHFLAASGGVLAASALPAGKLWARPADAAPVTAPPVTAANQPAAESMVKALYETLTPGQKEAICFGWGHVDPRRGLLRTRVSNNWQITRPTLSDDFYTDEQREIIRKIMEGIYSPEWIDRIDKQLGDDSGGWQEGSIAIFGEPSAPGADPGTGPGAAAGGKFEFVMTGRHQTIRCDGNTAEHVAFGGPIFYGHDADGFYEGPDHPGNVYWPQALAANGLYQMLDGEQQQAALVRRGMPRERQVAFKGAAGRFQGIPVAQLAEDQKDHLRDVLKVLLEPYREIDRQEVRACLDAQSGPGATDGPGGTSGPGALSGLDACHLAYYAQGDIGEDGVWDNWRLEGPSFVWHYRGAPHVHVWVHVADNPAVKLNA